jgi:hypothetical protein
VKESGAIIYNYPDIEVSALVCSCALDVADQGDLCLEDVGNIMSVTKERIRQMWQDMRRKVEADPRVRRLAGERGISGGPKCASIEAANNAVKRKLMG